MAMRVWLYARLSNDDDPAQNSLQNQQEICRAFAEKQGWTIIGSSTDDNISGMNFSRRGLDMLTAVVQAKQVDAVLVKDLSRLGRHRTQTALFIDFLRENRVRVISVTEGVDTFCEEDDLMIGVRGLMNDYYAKDIGKKIRAGYRQKQKEGLVITPPFGYWKEILDKLRLTQKRRSRCSTSILCTCRGAGKKRYPAGSMLWGERPRHNSGPSGAAKKYDKRIKPVTASSFGRMPA